MEKITNLLTAFLLTFLIASLTIPNGYSQVTTSRIIQKLDKCQTNKDSLNIMGDCIPISQEGRHANFDLYMSQFKNVPELKNYMIERIRLENNIPKDVDILFMVFKPVANKSIFNNEFNKDLTGGLFIAGGIVLTIVAKSPIPLLFSLVGLGFVAYQISDYEYLATITDDGSYFSITIEGMNEDQRKELLALFRQDYENYMAKTAAADSTETAEEAH